MVSLFVSSIKIKEKRMPKKPAQTKTVARSAKTGEFVTKAFAKKHPSTTEVERVKKGK